MSVVFQCLNLFLDPCIILTYHSPFLTACIFWRAWILRFSSCIGSHGQVSKILTAEKMAHACSTNHKSCRLTHAAVTPSSMWQRGTVAAAFARLKVPTNGSVSTVGYKWLHIQHGFGIFRFAGRSFRCVHMADPLSITASIITVVQLAGSLASFCLSCNEATKGKDSIIQQILDELKSLTDVLSSLARLTEENGPATHCLRALADAGGALDDCKVLLKTLKTELESIVAAQGVKKLAKIFTWPIKEKEVKSLLERLTQRKSTLALALHNVQMYQHASDL